MAESPSVNRDKLVRYALYCNDPDADDKDVTDAYPLIGLTIRKEINRIGKATLILDAGEKALGTFDTSDAATFKPGKKIKFSAGYEKEKDQLDVLFEGLIVTHRLAVNNREGAQVILECRDFAYAATQGRKSAVFEKAKDGDIIKKVLGNNGLSVTVDATTAQYPQLIQYYSTDWDFALARADANGLVVITEGKTVTVKKPAVSKGPVLTVAYEKDLIDFDGSLSVTDQYTETAGMAWEISTQKAISVTAANPSVNSQGDIAAKKLAEAGGEKLLYQTYASVGTDALQAWADGQALKNALARYQGSILFDGNAKAKPGCIIELKDMGTHFNGNAYIGAVEHTIREGGWRTKAFMGIDPGNVTDQPDVTAPAASGLLPGIEGLHIGKVKAIGEEQDAEHYIQVEMALLGDQKKTVWARLAHYYASNGAGCVFLPETDDEVVVGFINNDPCFPVILGSLYSRKASPPIAPDKENKQKGIVTKGKLKVTFDDDKLFVRIETPGHNSLLLDDDGKKVVVSDQNKNTFTLDQNGITLDSGKDLILKAKGNVKITATQNFETQSTSDTKIKGMNVNASATASLKLTGSASAEVSASGTMTVKGAMVMIN